jgi:hypothetical protein
MLLLASSSSSSNQSPLEGERRVDRKYFKMDLYNLIAIGKWKMECKILLLKENCLIRK